LLELKLVVVLPTYISWWVLVNALKAIFINFDITKY